MKPHSTFAAALAMLTAAAALASGQDARAYAGQKLARHASLTLAQARDIALKARPGKITDQELEKEGGGIGLRYSFDIRSGGVTFEVGVDARTGKVLENAREGSHPD